MPRQFGFFLVILLVACAASAQTQGGAIPVPLPLFPKNNWWNADISAAPVDQNSANFINFIGSTKSLRPDFGGDAGGGNVYGFPYIIVSGGQTKLTVTFDVDAAEESDGVNHDTNVSFPFYPIPSQATSMNGWIEGGQPGTVDERATSDRHILIVDQTNRTLYELFSVWYDGTKWWRTRARSST